MTVAKLLCEADEEDHYICDFKNWLIKVLKREGCGIMLIENALEIWFGFQLNIFDSLFNQKLFSLLPC